MALENLKKQYVEYRMDLKSLSPATETYRNIKTKMKEFLKEVGKIHGQETVDKIVGIKQKVKIKKAPEVKKPVIIVCEKCGQSMKQNRLAKHQKTQYCLYFKVKNTTP